MKTILIVSLSLLFIHELDAIDKKEWRLFFGLNKLTDNSAHKIFTLLHLPILIAVFVILVQSTHIVQFYFQIGIDVFLISHLALHIVFSKHEQNRFNNAFSMCLIAVMALLGVFDLILIMQTH